MKHPGHSLGVQWGRGLCNKKGTKFLDSSEVYKDREPLCRENSNKNKILHEMNY